MKAAPSYQTQNWQLLLHLREKTVTLKPTTTGHPLKKFRRQIDFQGKSWSQCLDPLLLACSKHEGRQRARNRSLSRSHRHGCLSSPRGSQRDSGSVLQILTATSNFCCQCSPRAALVPHGPVVCRSKPLAEHSPEALSPRTVLLEPMSVPTRYQEVKK